MKLCHYGCEKEAKYLFKNGKLCCSENWQSCDIHRLVRKSISKNIMNNDEIKKKISVAKKGLASWNKGKKGQIPWNKGKTGVYSKETLKKMSIASKNRVGYWKNKQRRVETVEKISKNHSNVSGKDNPNWKGGISCEPYCFEWSFKDFKNFIKERDGNKCLNPDCFRNVHKLCVHHIDYNKKNCELENLITLCNSCNSRANKDREWHTAWYEAILYRRYN